MWTRVSCRPLLVTVLIIIVLVEVSWGPSGIINVCLPRRALASFGLNHIPPTWRYIMPQFYKCCNKSVVVARWVFGVRPGKAKKWRRTCKPGWTWRRTIWNGEFSWHRKRFYRTGMIILLRGDEEEACVDDSSVKSCRNAIMLDTLREREREMV